MLMNRMKQRRRRGLSGQLASSSQRPASTAGPPLVGSKNNCFCEEEEDLLMKLHTLLGNRWSLIAGRLPGRTAKEVESYWNRHMRSKLKCTGLGPKKHRTTTFPLLPDDQQWRRRPRNACKVGRPDASKHPDRPPSSNAKVEEDVAEDCVPDAGSAC